jgi:hypothetical protein
MRQPQFLSTHTISRSFPFIITAKGKHSVQLKKPGYHPARLHNGKSRGFSNPLLKDKVALHPNGGEILNGRAQRCEPAPESALATGSHPGRFFLDPAWAKEASVAGTRDDCSAFCPFFVF